MTVFYSIQPEPSIKLDGKQKKTKELAAAGREQKLLSADKGKTVRVRLRFTAYKDLFLPFTQEYSGQTTS